MNVHSIAWDPASTSLLREAAEWHLLGLLLERPRPAWHRQLEAIAAEVADPELKSAAQFARSEATEGVYHTLLGPGGPATPREISVCGFAQPGFLLAEISATYEAFAYRPSCDEPLDHVAVESGFVAYLRFKEAYARACGDFEHAEVTAAAAQGFLEEHLSALAEPLATDLAESGVEYLALASAALLRRVGPSRRPALLEGLGLSDDEEGCCPRTDEEELLLPH